MQNDIRNVPPPQDKIISSWNSFLYYANIYVTICMQNQFPRWKPNQHFFYSWMFNSLLGSLCEASSCHILFGIILHMPSPFQGSFIFILSFWFLTAVGNTYNIYFIYCKLRAALNKTDACGISLPCFGLPRYSKLFKIEAKAINMTNLMQYIDSVV